jgi:aryl-alcohol dehydrogenase-like predicted oxidoreductase
LICLGCGNFGGIGSAPAFFGKGTNEDDARAIMDTAWASGLRWFDTADAYGGGASESFIGRWRADRRPEGLFVTTKVYNPLHDGGDRGLSRERIRRNVEASLERLGVKQIDYYLAHDRDLETPLAETVAAFEELVAEGVVGVWGLSNHDAAALREALGHGRPALVQNGYSLLNRGDEAELIPLCAEHGIDYVPFGPLEGGWLAGKYRRGSAYPEGSRMTMRPEPYVHLVGDRVFVGLVPVEAVSAGAGTV